MPITKHIGNPKNLKKISLPELQVECSSLKRRLRKTSEAVCELEEAKVETFNKGIGKNTMQKKMLAQEVKQIDGEIKLKFIDFTQLFKQYTFISNFITLKEHQKELEVSPIWKKILKLSPENFELMLYKTKFSGKNFSDILDGLNEALDGDVANTKIKVDKEEEEMFKLWDNLEQGTMNMSDVESRFSLERDMAKTVDLKTIEKLGI